MRKIIASLDIGSGLIKLVVGESYKGRIQILAAAQASSSGIDKGFVSDAELVVQKLTEVFSKCEDVLGLKIRNVILGLPSDGAEFFLAVGKTKVKGENHIVTDEDITAALDDAVEKKLKKNKKIVSITPTAYKIDGDKIDSSPVGMEGEKLSVQSLVITVPSNNIYSLSKCLNKIGVKITDYTLNSIAIFNEFKVDNMIDLVGAIVDIGEESTVVSVFNKGLLTNTSVIDIGAINIQKDLQYIFKVSRKDAKEIMTNLALANKKDASKNITAEYNNESKKTLISEYEATEVVEARIVEILKLIKKEINALTKNEIHYIMVTGGITDMSGFSSTLEKVFAYNAKVGIIKELGVRQNYYSVCLGLIKYYDEKTKIKNIDYSVFNEDELDELASVGNKINFGNNSILGKLFGYFFDN